MILARLHGYARTYLAGILAAKNPMNALKATTNHPDNGERMRNLLRGRERCRRSRKTRFQHVQEGGRCTNGSGNGSEVIR